MKKAIVHWVSPKKKNRTGRAGHTREEHVLSEKFKCAGRKITYVTLVKGCEAGENMFAS